MRNIVCIFLLTATGPAWAVTGSFRPTSNTFVLSPGVASPLAEADGLNFGGSGSLCVSSPLARAYEPNDGIDHLPKGEFVSLLKFDPFLCAGTTLSSMTLRLAITNGNQSAKGIFNYLGSPGDFDLYWISSDWQQGYGTSKTTAGLDAGITYTELMALLDQTTPAYLETLHYDARYSYWEGENWFTFELDVANENYAGLIEAIERGEVVTFMLMALQDSTTCFNFRAYVQGSADGTFTVRDTGPYLDVQTALPFSDVDFDASGQLDIADLSCIVDHWMETGDTLTGDIAPLGGDGVVDMLDLTEFMEHWQTPEMASSAIE
jgi:hypothetical protein